LARTKTSETTSGLPGISIKIDSKDLVSMNPEQLQALFEGLTKVAQLEGKKGIATTVAGP